MRKALFQDKNNVIVFKGDTVAYSCFDGTMKGTGVVSHKYKGKHGLLIVVYDANIIGRKSSFFYHELELMGQMDRLSPSHMSWEEMKVWLNEIKYT